MSHHMDVFHVHLVDLKFTWCSKQGCNYEMFPFSPPETKHKSWQFKNPTDCNILDYAQ